MNECQNIFMISAETKLPVISGINAIHSIIQRPKQQYA